MANKFLPHVHVVPEDDANRQIAQALFLEFGADTARYKLFPTERGWGHVLESFAKDHEKGMRLYSHRFVVLLIDFDNDVSRLEHAKQKIPLDLADRVFIFGVLSEPEELKPTFQSFDGIGEALGKDCREQTKNAWSHPLLTINEPEVLRFQQLVCPHLV